MSVLMALAWAIGVATLLKVMVGATVTLRPAAALDIVHLGACEALAFTVGLAAVLGLHARHTPASRILGIRPTHPALPVLGLALGLTVHFPAQSIEQLVEQYFPTPPEVLVARVALLTGETPLEVAAILLVVACIGPLVEELFFRGAMFGALRRHHSVVVASSVSGVSFVLGHLDPRLWAPLLVVAAVITHLRAASGSLLPGLALHVGFNTVTVLGVVTGAVSVASPPRLTPTENVVGWTVTAVLVFAVQYVGSRSHEATLARRQDEEA